MKRVLVLVLLLILTVGCVYDDPYYPVPPAPPPPIPVPPDPVDPPVPPEPTATVPRTIFDDLKVGDDASVLGGLPPPERTVNTDGGKTIWVWVLDEQRPDGSSIRWEVHVVDGKIVASFAW